MAVVNLERRSTRWGYSKHLFYCGLSLTGCRECLSSACERESGIRAILDQWQDHLIVYIVNMLLYKNNLELLWITNSIKIMWTHGSKEDVESSEDVGYFHARKVALINKPENVQEIRHFYPSISCSAHRVAVVTKMYGLIAANVRSRFVCSMGHTFE